MIPADQELSVDTSIAKFKPTRTLEVVSYTTRDYINQICVLNAWWGQISPHPLPPEGNFSKLKPS